MALSSIIKVFGIRHYSAIFRQISCRNFSEEQRIDEKKEPNDLNGLLRFKELEAKIKILETETLQFKDLYIRSMAEQENMRRRLTREIENEGNYAVTKFAKEMVDVSDNLNRALENTKPDAALEDTKKTLKELIEGVSMTREILKNVLTKFHITEVAPLGEKFDPNIHEALFAYEDKEKVPGTVGQVLSNGFKIKDRVLRSAKVGVIKK